MAEQWTTAQMPSQAGRIAVVTGANSGLGLETAIALAQAGAKVIMACRSPEKAAAALSELRARVPRADAVLMRLDLASLASVREFAASFKTQHTRLDLLINNAGILGVPLTYTVDGFESQMGTNHLGHFALTGLLIDALLATPGARIITVGSLGHWRAGGLDPDDLNYRHTPYTPFGGYCKSKLANLLFVLALSRRLQAKNSSLICAAAHPGGAATNIKKSEGRLRAAFERAIAPLVSKFLINTAAMGALPTLYAATMPGVRNNDYYGPNGFMEFRGHTPCPARRHHSALDAELAQRLWQASERATGVSFPD